MEQHARAARLGHSLLTLVPFPSLSALLAPRADGETPLELSMHLHAMHALQAPTPMWREPTLHLSASSARQIPTLPSPELHLLNIAFPVLLGLLLQLAASLPMTAYLPLSSQSPALLRRAFPS